MMSQTLIYSSNCVSRVPSGCVRLSLRTNWMRLHAESSASDRSVCWGSVTLILSLPLCLCVSHVSRLWLWCDTVMFTRHLLRLLLLWLLLLLTELFKLISCEKVFLFNRMTASGHSAVNDIQSECITAAGCNMDKDKFNQLCTYLITICNLCHISEFDYILIMKDSGTPLLNALCLSLLVISLFMLGLFTQMQNNLKVLFFKYFSPMILCVAVTHLLPAATWGCCCMHTEIMSSLNKKCHFLKASDKLPKNKTTRHSSKTTVSYVLYTLLCCTVS